MRLFLPVLFLVSFLVGAYEPPLPLFDSRYMPAPFTTTLAEQLRLTGNNSSDHVTINRNIHDKITKAFGKIDKDGDGVATFDEIMETVGQSRHYPTIIQELTSSPSFSQGSGNITLDKFVGVFGAAFTRSFTVRPGICREVSDRLELCRTFQRYATTDLRLKEILLREHVKCKTGSAGLSNYDFQRCILGSPCNQVPKCATLFQNTENDAMMSSVEKLFGLSVSDVAKLSPNDAKFKQFMSAWQVTGALSEAGVLTAFLAFLTSLVVETLKSELSLFLEEGVRMTFALVVEQIASLSPSFWIPMTAIIVALIAGYWALEKLLPLFWDLRGGSKSELFMESWNPYAGELEPKCEWATYFPQKCFTNNQLSESNTNVCEHGGERYRERMCAKENINFFYQKSCGFGKCKHMCYKTNFECGNDRYFYKNLTEFVTVSPTKLLNPYMFSPSFAEKQYVLLDSRYVYRMSECRDTCDKYGANMSPEGVSGCVGFVLRAPDPLSDPRQAFAKRQVCHMFALNNAETRSYFSEDSDTKYLNNIDDLLGYSTSRHNNFPPMIVALKQF